VETENLQSTRDRGNNAEYLAVERLGQLGYEILQRNYRCKIGEIDVIAKHGDELVFIEVRSRHSAEALDPIYSINRNKQKKIVRTAQFYLSRFRVLPFCRFDVVLVTLGDVPEIEIIADAFSL
jgi:putative endonuclease